MTVTDLPPASDYTPKPGHRVRVVIEGVIDPAHGLIFNRSNGFISRIPSGDFQYAVKVERLPDPEPEWQPGDVVLTAAGKVMHRVTPYGDGGWPWCQDPVRREGGLVDRLLPRPLIPLVRDGKPWPAGGAA